ncbi:Putative binding domain-containing protein, N-terminal [Siphonobacter aquaeclarae]|uniref:Putative binding domain-containing protein, N-terminal n=2 Tax=Siphonobacter aquaeclarae TaxID=563176 RepID=A0A1G9Y7Q6_9BACT|nr:Putative binding domain-containing protein, N-terminal [Siphonobacter aquaeclarae]
MNLPVLFSLFSGLFTGSVSFFIPHAKPYFNMDVSTCFLRRLLPLIAMALLIATPLYARESPAKRPSKTVQIKPLVTCTCGYTLVSVNQRSGETRGEFVFNSCSVDSLRMELWLGSTMQINKVVKPTSATIIFDMPAGAGSGTYKLKATPLNCEGTSSSVYEIYFNYTPPVPPGAISVSPGAYTFSASSGSAYFAITSTTSWAVASGSIPSWASVSGGSGSGNGSFTVSVTANTWGAARSGTLTLTASGASSITIPITQVGTNCYRFDVGGFVGIEPQRLDLTNSGIVKVNPANVSAPKQIWQVEDIGGYKKIARASNSNSVLGVAGGGSSTGSQVVLQSYTGGDHQLWQQESVSGCTGCVIFKRKGGGGVAFGSPEDWGRGWSDTTIQDIRLVSYSDATTYGGNKWVLSSVTCPTSGARMAAEEAVRPEQRLRISANPNAGEFKVGFFLAPGKTADLGVTDLSGRQLYGRAVKGEGEQTVDIKLAPTVSGIVVVSLKSDGKMLSHRVLVAK